ncbi:MAG TPA: lipopolysaccharide heptosyltransferase I [Acidiferrobacteraceae bacterium]|nr:lipopolysaccharide heptosyltransferase I [Acidiferrobacteraceae bacterium]
MRVLIVKTSSLGDVLHTLPAVTDARAVISGIRFDWVVEEAFAEIPRWHPAVDRVIPVATRRWRRQAGRIHIGSELVHFRAMLRARAYDCVIDAQGLLKSAIMTRMARGWRCGLDRQSARERFLGFAYQQRFNVPKAMHAIDRVRHLFSQALDYALPGTEPQFGVDISMPGKLTACPPYVVFLHGTSWASKRWPDRHWQALAQRANSDGYRVYLPWGDRAEQERAHFIAANSQDAQVVPRMALVGLARLLAGAQAAVAVDTGLVHLAAALGVPSVSLYGASSPVLTGTCGAGQIKLSTHHPCAPCLQRVCRQTYPQQTEYGACYVNLTPDRVWQAVQDNMLKPKMVVNE